MVQNERIVTTITLWVNQIKRTLDTIKEVYKVIYQKEYSIFYKFCCLRCLEIQKLLKEPKYPILLVFLLLTCPVMLFLKGNITDGIIVSLVSTVVTFSGYGALSFVVHRGFGHTGSKIKWEFSGKYLIPSSSERACLLNINGIEHDKFQFATEDDAYKTAVINVLAYCDTLWCAPLLQKFERNLKHIQRNRFSILLIKSEKNKTSHCGFIHMFPVDECTWNDYNNGKISDVDFSENNIVQNKEFTNDEPYGFILFSLAEVASDKEFITQLSKEDELGILIEQAVVYHAHCLFHHYYGTNKKRVKVLMQNFSDRYIKFFASTQPTMKNISFDANPIIEFIIAYNY